MPLSNLDEVPWHQLTHAYGTAEDVPSLLRQLETESADAKNEESALWHLFGNIVHQGTVYEATSHAVPFLLELASDPNLPKREGVIDLLGSIANGSSYIDAHEDIMQEIGLDGVGSPEHIANKKKELQWVANAKAEVAKGIELFVELTHESSSIRVKAADALSRFSDCDDRAGNRIPELLAEATDPIEEACFLAMAERSKTPDSTGSLFFKRLSHESKIVRRVATAICLSQKFQLDSKLLREQMMEAVLDAGHESLYEVLPIEFSRLHFLPENCIEEFTASEKEHASDCLCGRLKDLSIESSQAELLLDLSFPELDGDRTCELTHKNLQDNQRRVLEALLDAFNSEGFKIHSLCFENWGLPEYRRDLKNLVEGKPPNKIDNSLPLLGTEHDPRLTVQLIDLKAGDRVHHRYFGFGTIKDFDELEGDWEIEFDEEGTHFFSFRQDDLTPKPWWSRFLGRFTISDEW